MKILTFDIEEWFHILDNDSTRSVEDWKKYESRFHQNMDRIFELLENQQAKATFFCLGWVAEKYPEVIKQIDNLGYEIGTHSYAHQLVYEHKPNEFEEDLKKSIDILEAITGKKVKSYRSPGFSITEDTPWAFDIMHSLGIEVDCSVFPARRAHGGMNGLDVDGPFILEHNGIQLKEFPINTKNMLNQNLIFSGGGYFRLLPYSGIKKLFASTDYVMTYFHPRDFDHEQPVIKELSVLRKFKSYYGLKNALPKLSKLMDEFEFTDISGVDAQMDWNSVKRVKIR